MRRIWVIGTVVALGILLLIAFLGEPVGALLGILVLLSAAATGVIASNVVYVRQRSALVVLSAQHDAVLRAVMGPGRTFLLPFREKEGPVMDTGYRLEPVYVHDVLQANQQPATLRFTAYVVHQLAPDTISPVRLGEILPELIDNLSGIVQHYTDYCLRNLVAGVDPARIHNGGRDRLDRHLELMLKDRLVGLGIAVHGVQLVIWPPAGLQETLTNAETHRVGITLQAEQLETILNALTDQSDEARSLALLELARSLGGSGQVWTGLDLASLLDGRPSELDRPSSLVQSQLPIWARAVEGRPYA
jgi:hypothetical protein